MTTLKDVLAQQDSITTMAKGLGLINLRIFQIEEEESTLNLLVDHDTINLNSNSLNNGILEAWLVQTLQCKVAVTVSQRLEPFYKEEIIETAAGLDNTTRLEYIYKTSDFTKVSFTDAPILSGAEKAAQDYLAGRADEIVSEQNQNTVSNLTSNPFFQQGLSEKVNLSPPKDDRKRKRDMFIQFIQEKGISPEEAVEFATDMQSHKEDSSPVPSYIKSF